MLSARRKSDGQIVSAYFESKRNAPFLCNDCNEEVILKSGRNRVDHFAHANPIACKFSPRESDAHRKCKMEIYEALKRQPNVRDVALEKRLGEVRADIYAVINGTPVAIEVQISSLSLETITQRTIYYAQKGIYVLWLLQWTPALDSGSYTPKLWERWIHAAYFGRVYYWTEALTVISYRFESATKIVPRRVWRNKRGGLASASGYVRTLKRTRVAVRGASLSFNTDFTGKQRYWWEGGGLRVPDAKLYLSSRLTPAIVNVC